MALLDYHDAVIYLTDERLLQPGGWLNDRLINFSFRYFEFAKEFDKTILLMDPSVVSFLRIQCTDAEDYIDLARGIDLPSRKLILMPCNDSVDFESSSTHWSLVAYELDTGLAIHLDSHHDFNLNSARDLIGHLGNLVGWVLMNFLFFFI
jgi:hypothetical protein